MAVRMPRWAKRLWLWLTTVTTLTGISAFGLVAAFLAWVTALTWEPIVLLASTAGLVAAIVMQARAERQHPVAGPTTSKNASANEHGEIKPLLGGQPFP